MDYIYEELERQRAAMERLLQPVENRGEEPQKAEEVIRRVAGKQLAEPSAFRVGAFAEDAAAMPMAVESGVGLYSAAASAHGEAERVSRTVERDARRYDGGYQMY